MTPEQLTAILVQKLQEDAATMVAEYGPMSLMVGTAAIGAVGLIWGASKLFCRRPAQHVEATQQAVQESVQVVAEKELVPPAVLENNLVQENPKLVEQRPAQFVQARVNPAFERYGVGTPMVSFKDINGYGGKFNDEHASPQKTREREIKGRVFAGAKFAI